LLHTTNTAGGGFAKENKALKKELAQITTFVREVAASINVVKSERSKYPQISDVSFLFFIIIFTFIFRLSSIQGRSLCRG
jgi:hypothetical protein